MKMLERGFEIYDCFYVTRKNKRVYCTLQIMPMQYSLQEVSIYDNKYNRLVYIAMLTHKQVDNLKLLIDEKNGDITDIKSC